jgi:hypothetical protein
LGPSVSVAPPKTTATVTIASGANPAHVAFAAEAHSGNTVVRTEYRLVGETDTWTAVDAAGLDLSAVGTHVVAYRSVDSAGLTESARAVVVTVLAAPPSAP